MRFLRFKRWLSDLHETVGGFEAVFLEAVRRHAGVDAAHAYGGWLAILTACASITASPTPACR